VLVTARLPRDELALALAAGPEGRDGPVVRLVGDAWSPGTIAAAVWEGRRYAEELDEPTSDDDAPPFQREVVSLAPLGG
jgi:dimethylamine/trimethylamine dehydrogenase